MSRKLIFLSVHDHNLIYSHQLSEFARQFRKALVGCKLLVDYAAGTVNISAPINSVDVVSSNKGALLREAYFKLGCSQVTLYCCGEHIWDYNWHESPTHESEIMSTAATLERPTATATTTTDKYISIERAALAMKMSDDELLDLLQQQAIPVILRDRQPWGMDSASAKSLAEWNYHQQLITMGLEYDEENPPLPMVEIQQPIAATVPAAQPEEQAVEMMEAELDPQQFASAIKNGSSEANSNVVAMPASKGDAPAEMQDPAYWSLPDGYTIKPTPKTTFKTALKNALLQLELGDRFFVDRLKCLKSPRKFPEAKAFLEAVTAQYKSKPDQTKAISELLDEAKANPMPPAS
jgi:hypothetical protein